jgi:methyl-accepting chemotaxis protein
MEKAKLKTLSALLVVALVLSMALPVVSVPMARAASGSISINPVKFTISGTPPSLEPTTVVLNGGVFGSGATVKIYISPDKTFTTTADILIGTVTLEAGQTSFINTVVVLSGTLGAGWTPGTYYIAATDDDGKTWTSWVEVTLTLQNPEITLYDVAGNPISSANPAKPGDKVTVRGTGFTANTEVRIYLGRPGGLLLASTTTKPDGSFSVDFTVPNLAKGDYKVIAQQADTLQDEEYLPVREKITVEPFSVGTATGQVITVKGYGFTKGAKVSANSITVDGATVTNPEVVVADDGTFTVTATITTTMTTGWKTVTVTSDKGDSAQAKLLVSAPGFTATSVSLLGGTTSANVKVKEAKRIYVWNYPANIALRVLMGSAELGTITTNSIGAGYLDVTIPELPGSASGVEYKVDAVNYDQGIVAVNPLTLKVATSLYVELQDTFVTRTGVVARIYGYGAAPLETLTIGFVNNKIDSNVTKVKANALGSFSTIVKLTAKDTTTTGQQDTAQVTGTLTGTVQAATPVTIWRDDQASISLDKYCSVAGDTVTVSVSNLRPSTSYEVLFGGVSLPTKVTFTTTSAGGVSPAPSFTVPSVAQGPYKVSVVVAGTTIEHAYKHFVVSSPGTVPSFSARAPGRTPSQTITVSPGDKVELYVFGFSSGETIEIYRVGAVSAIASQSGGTAGGYLYEWTVPDMPSGTYRLYVRGSIAGTIGQYVYLIIVPKFTSFSPTSGSIGTSVSFSAKGLTPNTAFNIIFGDLDLGYVGTSDSSGSLSGSFTVPTVVEGTYTVKLVPSSDPTRVVLSRSFTVTAPSGLTVTPNPCAFPTQLITFKWAASGLTVPVYVYVSLDGYSYVKLEDVNYDGAYIYGSFSTPNVATPGTVLKLTLKYEDRSSPTKTGTADIALKIVEGKGALVVGLTSEQAATLARIDTNVGTVLARLDDLSAKVVDIKDGLAVLDTRFGTMSAKLDAINATIVSVKDGLATVTTALGDVKVSLSNLNARIEKVSGDLVTLSTAVGKVTTTLDAINAKVVSISGDVATIKTDVGTISGKVTSIDGSVATIKTDVGTIKATIADVKTTAEAAKSAAKSAESVAGSLMIPVWVAAAFAIIATVLAIVSIVMIQRKIAK